MNEQQLNGIISVNDKSDLQFFVDGLVAADWQLFATAGTVNFCLKNSGTQLGLLDEFVTDQAQGDTVERETTAQRVSSIMLGTKAVQLACVNLRPARLEATAGTSGLILSHDVGGISMILAASNSGALVVTNPARYEEVLANVTTSDQVDKEFLLQLQEEANQHIITHLTKANRLIS